MHDAFLVGVLYAGTDLAEQLQACLDIQPIGITITHQGIARHILHGEEGETIFGSTGLEKGRDVRVREARHGLAFCIESGQRLGAAQAGVNQFQRDPALDRLLLLGQVNRTHAAFTQCVDYREMPDPTGVFGRCFAPFSSCTAGIAFDHRLVRIDQSGVFHHSFVRIDNRRVRVLRFMRVFRHRLVLCSPGADHQAAQGVNLTRNRRTAIRFSHPDSITSEE